VVLSRRGRAGGARRSSFARPWWVSGAVGAIAGLAVAAVVCAAYGLTEVAVVGGNVALIVTLIVVSLYTHFTAIYAKAAAYPSVSFWLDSPTSGYFQFWIQNYSGVPVRCWCRLNPTYDGKRLHFEGFYEGKKAFDVLPHQTVHGAAFELTVLFTGEHAQLWNQIVDRVNGRGLPRLDFEIEFWYEAPEVGFRSAVVIHRYYYSFGTGKLVLNY